jgi:hypothetical protein
MTEMPGLAYTAAHEQNQLLAHVMLQQETAAEFEEIEDNMVAI